VSLGRGSVVANFLEDGGQVLLDKMKKAVAAWLLQCLFEIDGLNGSEGPGTMGCTWNRSGRLAMVLKNCWRR
jgi:hypothetical protein